jgi:predicted amidohydrolase YtcJ
MIQADAVYRNGVIHTMDSRVPEAQAIAVIGNIIAGVGSNEDMEPLTGPGTRVFDLGGKTVLPGFNDSHNHMACWGVAESGISIAPESCPDLQTMKKLLAQRAVEARPGEWLCGWGFDEGRMKEGRRPVAQDLDEGVSDHPVLLTRNCGHISVANSAAIKLAGIDDNTPDPQGGQIVRDEHGHATGILLETAQDIVKGVIPPLDKDDIVRALELATKHHLSMGITSSTDAGVVNAVKEEIEGWVLAHTEEKLRVRTYTMLFAQNWDRLLAGGFLRSYGNDTHRFGSVKFLLDGGVSGGTAVMYEPYQTPPGTNGILYMEQDELNETLKKYHESGLQISCHAIGDRTIDQVLNAYEKVLQESPRPNHRHRIEHFSMATPRQMERAKALHVNVTMNPGFFYYLGDSHLDRIGERVQREFPMKQALAHDLMIGIGSDSPVINVDPKYSLYASVFRKTMSGKSCGTEQAISMRQAVWAYTQAGAYMSFEENRKGSITQGKLADFVVLSLDPMAICENEAEKLLEMQVIATVLDGECLYGGID